MAGLVGLAMAIRLRLTDDMSTAWYVVALLPRTVVAGQGVKIWLVWPLPYAVVLVVLDTLKEKNLFYAADIDRLTPVLGLILLVVFSGLVLRVLPKEEKIDKVYKEGTYKAKRKRRPEFVGHFIAATLIAVAGGLLMSEGALLVVRGAREADIPVLHILTQGVFFGTMVLLVGGFLVGAAGAAVLDHPLLRVDISSDSKVDSIKLLAPLKNQLYLVAHADGYWYFLDDENNELLSAPDELVLAVRTISSPGE